MDQNTKADESKQHPFNRTLGLGPYTVVGFFALKLPSEANQGRNNFHLAPKVERGIGSCAHCGHAITNIYIVSNGDGLRFGIGSDCVLKAGLPQTEISKVERNEKGLAKKRRAELKVKKGNAARLDLSTMIESMSQVLQSKPHPSRSDLNLLDYANFVLKRSGEGGIVIALKKIRLLLK